MKNKIAATSESLTSDFGRETGNVEESPGKISTISGFIRVHENGRLFQRKDGFQRSIDILLGASHFLGLSIAPRTNGFTSMIVTCVWCLVLCTMHFLLTLGELKVAINDAPTSHKEIAKFLFDRFSYASKSITHITLFLIFWLSSKRLESFMQKWVTLSKRHYFTHVFEKGMLKKIYKIVVIAALMRIFSFALPFVIRFINNSSNSFDTYLYLYGKNVRKGIYKLFGSNKGITFAMLVVANLSTCDWEFICVFLIVIYEFMNRVWRQYVVYLREKADSGRPVNWDDLRMQYVDLISLSRDLDDCLSPFNLISIVAGIFRVLRRLYTMIEGDLMLKFGHFFYLTHSITVLFVLIMSANKLIEIRDEIEEVLNHISNDHIKEGKRFEFIVSKPLQGMTGCKFFTLNRSLINVVIGIILTYEVILLQVT